jgi:hypothetical protein
MEFPYHSFGHPVKLKIKVRTSSPTAIRIQAKDAERPSTHYINRFNTIKGEDAFYIRLPKSPNTILIRLLNNKTRDDEGFTYLGYEVLPLDTKMSLSDFENRDTASFIKFAEEFADRAGYLSTGKYLSSDGKFNIDYLPTIMSGGENGKELNTPARISAKTGKVEVSKKQFVKFTVAGRFAILLHEFSHVFANKNVKDEVEADFHAAQIYLALGYPRIELLNIFGSIFMGADTDGNRKRFDMLKKYVLEFDSNVQKVAYK